MAFDFGASWLLAVTQRKLTTVSSKKKIDESYATLWLLYMIFTSSKPYWFSNCVHLFKVCYSFRIQHNLFQFDQVLVVMFSTHSFIITHLIELYPHINSIICFYAMNFPLFQWLQFNHRRTNWTNKFKTIQKREGTAAGKILFPAFQNLK